MFVGLFDKVKVNYCIDSRLYVFFVFSNILIIWKYNGFLKDRIILCLEFWKFWKECSLWFVIICICILFYYCKI